MNYYNDNAQLFFDGTNTVDMASIYKEFLPLIPQNGTILDAGCGSGRDSKAFIKLGFKVHSIDASRKLAEIASLQINQKVEVTTFQEFNTITKFDAVWACASLLHVPMKEMKLSFYNLSKSLKSDGIFYCSFKYGLEEIKRNDGRNFTNLNEELLKKITSELPLKIAKSWCTSDLRPNRQNEKWLNAILIKE